MADGKRQQLKNVEDHLNTRQDRNLFLTSGGTLQWNDTTGILSWSSPLQVWAGGVPLATVNAGDTSASPLLAAGDALYVELDRDTGGGTLTPGAADPVTSANQSTDDRVLLGVRGSDGKFYWRNGTVMSDGASKTFGTVQSLTDRDVQTSTGVLAYTTFVYGVGLNQLQVYVGGILQQNTVDYTEAAAGAVNFVSGREPAAGEIITFLNVVGGQGPAGSVIGSLQDAYDNGETVSAGSVSVWHQPPGLSTPGPVVLGVGDAATPTVLAGMTAKGWFKTSPAAPLDAGAAGLVMKDGEASSVNGFFTIAPLDDGSGDTIFLNIGEQDGFLLKKDGSGMEWGTYPGTFPDASVWAGEGPIRWAVYTGTLDSSTIPSASHATGLTTILGVVASVEQGAGSGVFSTVEHAGAASTAYRWGVSFNSSGVVQITGETYAATSVDPTLNGAAYRLLVFYQG